MKRSVLLVFIIVLLGAPLGVWGDMNDKSKSTQVATFAGGCFWCLQPPFDKLPGVEKTVVGYTGGTKKNPSYDEISTGTTGHLEAIEIYFDSSKITYNQLLDIFWKNIDPTQADGQFADIGSQYQTAILFHSGEQKRIAEESKAALAKSGKFQKPIVTNIRPAGLFYPAEEYHQEYYEKNPSHYSRYKVGSGRAAFIEKTWGK